MKKIVFKIMIIDWKNMSSSRKTIFSWEKFNIDLTKYLSKTPLNISSLSSPPPPPNEL